MNQGHAGYPLSLQGYGAPFHSPYIAPASVAYGAPQQYWGVPPSVLAPPSPGYGPNLFPPVDATAAAKALYNALISLDRGSEAILISTLSHYPAADIPNLAATYRRNHSRDLEADITRKTKPIPLVGSHFTEALLAIARGPLHEDVFLLRKSLKGAGTNEKLLNDVVLSRSNADLNAIKAAYYATYQRTAEADVDDDFSGFTEGNTRRFYSMVLAATRADEPAPVIPQAIESDVDAIHIAAEANKDQMTVCSILSSRSDAQIRAIAHFYEQKFRITLEKVILKDFRFSPDLKNALIQIVSAALDRAMRDAVRLEECMKGAGTKDDLLVARVVQLHWNRDHMGQVKGAYKIRYKKDLVARIHGELSGNYQTLLKAMVG